MSESKNPPTPNEAPQAGVRQAALRLLADLDQGALAQPGGVPGLSLESVDALRWALVHEPTAEPQIPNAALARDGIDLIKRHAPPGELTPDHITAVVDAAEAALSDRSFGIRWDGDMRAIKRWQAAGEGRDLIWPDHADLVVWLLELIEQRPPCPSPDEVDEMIRRLRAVYVASPMIAEACGMMEKLANALIASSRRTVLAESNAEISVRLIVAWLRSQGMPSSRVAAYAGVFARQIEAGEWLPLRGAAIRAERELHVEAEEQGRQMRIVHGHDLISGCEESIVGDLGKGSMEQTYSGDAPAAEHWLVEKARADGLIADGVVWQEPGEGGRLMAEYLAELSGLPIQTRTGPRLLTHDSLRTVLGRPDVREAIAKALAGEAKADWEAATEAGRNAFRDEAAKLLGEAAAAPRS